jgi:hypothetical protein
LKNDRAKEISEARRGGFRVDITEVLVHFLYTDLILSPRSPDGLNSYFYGTILENKDTMM